MGDKSQRLSIFKHIFVPLLVECTAQFFHTYWGVMSSPPYIPPTNNGSQSAESSASDNYFQNVFVPAIQAGLSVWMQIVVFWKVSVAHFNPAVSLGFVVSGNLKPIMFIPYVLSQCLGSVIAALIAKEILGANPAIVLVPDEASSVAVFFNEFIITGILVFYAVATVVDETYDQATGPIAVGLTIFQGILSAQGVGVACVSPSRAFGPAVATGGAAWNRHWLLWLGDLAGAAVASAYFMLVFAPDKKCWILKLKRKLWPSSSRSHPRAENNLIDKSNSFGTTL